MKAAVVYHSQTGNTRKVAEAIAAELPGCEVLFAPIQDHPDLDECSLVFVGLPIERFGPAEPAVAYLKEACAGRRIALFVTHATEEDSPQLEPWLDKCRSAAADAEVVALFHCQGALGTQIKTWMLNSGMPDMVKWAQSDTSEGQPDETRLQRAREFASETAERFLTGEDG